MGHNDANGMVVTSQGTGVERRPGPAYQALPHSEKRPTIREGASITSRTIMNRSEEIRLRYLYRRLILNGKTGLSLEAARGLVGPDCAFHLYGVIASGSKHLKKRKLKK